MEINMMSLKRYRAAVSGCLVALALGAVGTAAASAETLLMPKRDTATGVNTVVWGISTKANGTPFIVDFGDGSTTTGTVADRSYIAFNHTYALANTYSAQLCVGQNTFPCTTAGSELATTDVKAYNLAVMSDFDKRNVNINRAIED